MYKTLLLRHTRKKTGVINQVIKSVKQQHQRKVKQIYFNMVGVMLFYLQIMGKINFLDPPFGPPPVLKIVREHYFQHC